MAMQTASNGGKAYAQAWNQTEQTERRVRSGSARWLACSVRLAQWRDPVARARLGSAEQPNRLLGLGSAEPNRAARLLALGGVHAAECATVHPWLLIG